MMDNLYYTSLFLFALIFLIKSSLHAYLDYKNGESIGYSRGTSYIQLLPYEDDVAPENERKKKLCNVFWRLSIFFLVSTFVLAILRYVLPQM